MRIARLKGCPLDNEVMEKGRVGDGEYVDVGVVVDASADVSRRSE